MPMDTRAPWRAIEAPGAGQTEPSTERKLPGGSRLLLAAALLLVAASVGVALLVAGRQGGQVELLSGDPGAGDAAAGGPAAIGPASGVAGTPAASQAMLVVEVAGAVAHPGVYSLPLGSRVEDAIKAAGGYSPDVDPRQAEAQLNLAAKLTDAETIRVPRRGDGSALPSGGGTAAASHGPLDLNTATAEQLDTLPGVGPATAQKIIAAREQKPFKSVNDLVTRKVVTASVLAKFRSLVTVG
jgi:competence protein ComEA